MVTPPNVGGAFGMKAFVYPEQALVVWAAGKLKRPVRWQSDRSEGFISDNQGRDHFTSAELALDAKGKFLGIRVSLIANVGAYLSPMGSIHSHALDRPDLRPLHHAGDRHQRERRVHQHGAGLRLSRRRPARGGLLDRAAGRCRRARAEHDAGQDPPHQLHSAGGHSLHVADQARVRLRRVREGDGPLHGERPTGRASRRGAARARSAASCAASAWRPTPSAAAAAFPRPRRSSSRATASTS